MVVPQDPRAAIAALPWAALLPRYAKGVETLDRRVLELDDELVDLAFRPEAGVGRWSCRTLMTHLADAELVLTHRIRRTVAEDHPVLALWDHDAFADAGLAEGAGAAPKPPIAGSVAVIHTLRLWSRDWLATLPESARDRTCLHPEAGSLSVADLVARTTAHLEHHAAFLKAKLDRLVPAEASP